jgi:hypothetical protein
MAGNTKFGIDIVADDTTAKGFSSADKQAKAFASNQDKRNKTQAKFESAFEKSRAKAEKDRQDRLKATGAGAAGRGFSAAETAFGGGAISGAVSGKLGAVAAAGNSIKSAFAAANHEGAGLAEKLGAVSVAGAAATGIIAGLDIAAYKMASGWTEGGAALGRLSAGIGISTDQLQRWQGAGEKFGVDKDTMGGAIGSFASTMNDAKYGRNNTALAAMNQLGIQMKTGPDGNIDVGAMFSDASDAVKRQTNPQTQKRIVELLGIGDGALPAIRQGGTALRDAGAEYARYGGMWSSQDVKDSTRLYGEGVQARQGLDREGKGFQRAAALTGEGAMTAAIAHDRARVDGSGGDSARFISEGARTFSAAVNHFGSMLEKWAAGLDRSTLGGRLNNPGNMRPVGGGGFMRYATPADGLVGMGRQLLRDQDVYGARTPRDLIEGAVGRNGKRRMGYAPSSDHNDTAAYLRDLKTFGGIDPDSAINLHDPDELARYMSAAVRHESRTRLSPDDILPAAKAAETRTRVDVEVHDRRTVMRATTSRGGKPVAVAHAMSGSGP